MLLRDRKTRKISSKANHKTNLSRQHLKPHLLLYRHLPRFLRWLLLLRQAQLVHNRNTLTLSTILHGGLAWYFSSAVRLFNSPNDGDIVHEQ